MSIAATFNRITKRYAEMVTYTRPGVTPFSFTAAVSRHRPQDIGFAGIVQDGHLVVCVVADLTAGGITTKPRPPDKIHFDDKEHAVLDAYRMRDEGGVIIGYKISVRG